MRHGRSPPSGTSRRDSASESSSRKRPEAVLNDKDRNRREGLSREEEKKRGKRLFGGLLSTLSQTTSNSQQKRRQEIEKRQQEKAAKQKIEDDKRRSEGRSKLDKVRKIEQVRFDEQVMNTRHSNMLAMAHSLLTKSEPKLYYRPWKTTQEQQDIIKDQIRDTKAQIEDELQRFRVRKEQRLKDLGVLSPSLEVDATVGEPAVEDDRSRTAAQDESAVSATNDRRHSPATARVPQRTSHEEKDHDEMVEAEEDTVIY
ncbi:hypothetical protein M406DRAFT_246069 [Cryphonectria parasitica EP155]|uniref:Pinin/SDK/MemA protein domain-containing protein n=1 Tax=Cryphonectria parasitica (strain ATCC 38755 / EP155) TaxID=660469 RepID=A0A9P4YB78_CRYP1|nr:uncharacterized protein M406DRAFT_246069 [Cryphonectria parasitica EP155]KAF3770146.1 hypothetical protein M406DRAFT_246069 [Cryphonectria parasitica EP155]